jgi:hypothetical protein
MLITPLYGVCDTCRNETEIINDRCALCTRLGQKQKNIRVGGTILTVCGLIVIGMMSYFIYLVVSIDESRNSQTVSKWTSSEVDLILTIFCFVLAYGISLSISGLWHAVTGEVNKMLLYVMSGVGFVLFIGARIIIIGK